jgi:RNA polymerase sigma-70 factor, ECF subfamily
MEDGCGCGLSEQREGGPVPDSIPPADWADATRVFNEHRNLLIGVAYRILGRVSDAEDVVQDAWLRWVNARPSEVADPRAFLVRVTSRLAIDQLRRVKTRHESYVGPWLPEPLLTDRDVTENAELAESISIAMLIVLETLSALERTVFVLREAFGMTYAEIAEILGRSEPAVRQLARRAREHVRERTPRFDTDQAARRRVTERFLAATVNGNLDDLLAVLAPGVTLVGDGGGRARAPLRPIYGADKVARFLVAMSSEPLPDAHLHIAQVNGGPGILAALEGKPVAAVILDVAGGVIQTIHLVANPDKLIGIRAIEAETN